MKNKRREYFVQTADGKFLVGLVGEAQPTAETRDAGDIYTPEDATELILRFPGAITPPCTMSEFFRFIGRKGGASKSPKKLKALSRARIKRWRGHKARPRTHVHPSPEPGAAIVAAEPQHHEPL